MHRGPLALQRRAVREVRRRADGLVRAAAFRWKTLRARVNRAPIVILGNQKSGTSAIATLLALAADASISIDLRREIEAPSFDRVSRGDLSFRSFVRRNKLDFSRDVVKAPDLTPLFDQVQTYFPAARFAFIVRDPRDNIRSILDRLGLPGDLDRLTREQWRLVSPAWRLVLDGRWLGLTGRNYVERLAARWNLCAEVYLKRPRTFARIRYEDFERDKIAEVRRIAGELNLAVKRDVADRVEVQYQPRGANRGVPHEQFFGSNLERIDRICAARMARFGYERRT